MPVTFQVVGNLADFGNDPRADVLVRAHATPSIKVGDVAVHSNEPEAVKTDGSGAFTLELVSLPGVWYRIHTPYSGAIRTVNLAGYIPDSVDPTTGEAFPDGTVIDLVDVIDEDPAPGYEAVVYADGALLAAHAGGTTDVHGIPDTAALVLTDDARLSDARTPTAHGHVVADTTGLQAALDGKASTAQGTKADAAVQPDDLATVATTGVYADLTGRPTLGTAAATDATGYATAAQGAKADTAVQPSALTAETAARTAALALKADRSTLAFNVKDYGAVGDGSNDDTAAISATLDAASALVGATLGTGLTRQGATVHFPPGDYRTTSALKMRPYVSLTGAGRRSARLYNNTTDLFAWGDGDPIVQDVAVRDLWFSTGSAGGHVFNLTGTTGTTGLTLASFSDVTMSTRNPASSLWKQRGRAQLIDVVWDHCNLDRAGGTVPAFDIVVGGNDANSLQWVNSRCHGHLTTGAPFFYVESTGAWNYNLTFRDLVGEQNCGGFIHLKAVDGVQIINCPDWDAGATAYTDSVYEFTSGAAPARPVKNVRIESSYRIASTAGLAAGKYDIEAQGANLNFRAVNVTPPGLTLAAILAGDARIEGRTVPFKTVTATATLLADDVEQIICNSATAFTLTLPAAISSVYGRRFIIKNIGAGTVTLSPNVDGASKTLAQWERATVLTDGANANFGRIWFTV